MPVPTAEKPPRGLNAYWLGVWRHALKTLKAQGTWAWEQKPLLDEYVYALKAAEEARVGYPWLEALEQYAERERDELPEVAWTVLRQIADAVPANWDRHSKRASALAEQLVLTPKARRALKLKPESKEGEDGGENKDPFAALDEVSAKRQEKGSYV